MGATVLSLGWWKTFKGGGADVGAIVGGGCAEEDEVDVSVVGGSGYVEYAYPRFSEILRKYYGSRGSLENHFSKTWRSLPPSCFLLKQPNFRKI